MAVPSGPTLHVVFPPPAETMTAIPLALSGGEVNLDRWIVNIHNRFHPAGIAPAHVEDLGLVPTRQRLEHRRTRRPECHHLRARNQRLGLEQLQWL